MSLTLDLGDDHVLRFIEWRPDRSIEAHRDLYRNIEDIERYGAVVTHRTAAGNVCEMFVTFDTPEVRALNAMWVVPPRLRTWTVDQWEPLTLGQPLLCSACGDHGFVRDGRWVRA